MGEEEVLGARVSGKCYYKTSQVCIFFLHGFGGFANVQEVRYPFYVCFSCDIRRPKGFGIFVKIQIQGGSLLFMMEMK